MTPLATGGAAAYPPIYTMEKLDEVNLYSSRIRLNVHTHRPTQLFVGYIVIVYIAI